MVNTAHCNAGDMGSIPGWVVKIPHITEQLSPMPQLLKPKCLEPMLCNKMSPHTTTREQTLLTTTREKPARSDEDPM